MILTITLNPSLDRVIWIDKLQHDDSVRIQREKVYAGGKGIDASRVICSLGGETSATGFLGSFTGLQLEGLLINEGVTCDFVKIADDTRSNVIIFQENEEIGQKGHIALNSKGPEVTPYDLASLFVKLSSMRSDISYVIIGGSMPHGLNPNLYAQMIHLFRDKGIKVALDADGEALKLGLKEKPFLIKPNEHEFSRLMGKTFETEAELIAAGRQLMTEIGLEIILISRGPKGLIIISADKAYTVMPPVVEVKSTIGSGDSALAAFMLGLEQGKSLPECGVMAVAAGAATAMTPGVELANIYDFSRLLPNITYQEV